MCMPVGLSEVYGEGETIRLFPVDVTLKHRVSPGPDVASSISVAG